MRSKSKKSLREIDDLNVVLQLMKESTASTEDKLIEIKIDLNKNVFVFNYSFSVNNFFQRIVR